MYFPSLTALRHCLEKMMINEIRTVKSHYHFYMLSLLWWMNSYEDKCSSTTYLRSLLHPTTHTQLLIQMNSDSCGAVQEIATQRFPWCSQSTPLKEEIKVCSEGVPRTALFIQSVTDALSLLVICHLIIVQVVWHYTHSFFAHVQSTYE